ncbi:hypothetical protein RFI_20298, partial [Reticulomyxa filosa]
MLSELFEEQINNNTRKCKCKLLCDLKWMRKKEDEINFDNMWKFSSRSRYNFLCSSSPTLVITPIQIKEFKSPISVLKFLGLKSFQEVLLTIYVHFAVNASVQQICDTFDNKKALDEDEKSENQFKKSKRQIKYQIIDETMLRKLRNENNKKYSIQFGKVKRSQRNIGYSIDQIKLFNRIPMVMVTLSKSEDVMKILQDKDLQNVYTIAQAVLFDKNKSRPKSYFKQCQNCFKLNHVAKECPSIL